MCYKWVIVMERWAKIRKYIDMVLGFPAARWIWGKSLMPEQSTLEIAGSEDSDESSGEIIRENLGRSLATKFLAGIVLALELSPMITLAWGVVTRNYSVATLGLVLFPVKFGGEVGVKALEDIVDSSDYGGDEL